MGPRARLEFSEKIIFFASSGNEISGCVAISAVAVLTLYLLQAPQALTS